MNDADGLGSLNYQWLRSGVAIAGATNQHYTLTSADLGHGMSVRVHYTDGGGKTEYVYSPATGSVVGDTTPTRQKIFIHSDLLGSPTVQTNDQGEVL